MKRFLFVAILFSAIFVAPNIGAAFPMSPSEQKAPPDIMVAAHFVATTDAAVMTYAEMPVSPVSSECIVYFDNTASAIGLKNSVTMFRSDNSPGGMYSWRLCSKDGLRLTDNFNFCYENGTGPLRHNLSQSRYAGFSDRSKLPDKNDPGELRQKLSNYTFAGFQRYWSQA